MPSLCVSKSAHSTERKGTQAALGGNVVENIFNNKHTDRFPYYYYVYSLNKILQTIKSNHYL